MVTPAEKRSSNKFCDFHNDKGHNTDECMQLKKQIEELVRAGKLWHLIKEIKQGRDQTKKVTQSFARVSEITFPPLTTSKGTEGPLVIEAEIGGHMIHCMYVDGGSSTEVLYEHCFNRLRPEIKSQMAPTTTSLTGFSGETIWPLGQLRLLVTIGDADHSTKAWMNFMIVRSLSPYNGIIGRPGIREIQAVPSTAHGMLKAEVRHENFKIALHTNFPDQEVAIGGTLSAKRRTKLCSLLKKNLDIFAWRPLDMTGVSRSIVEHRLNIREGYSPVRQKKRGQAPERAKAIQAEHDGSWRMCVDFTDLNKACPQDCYPLPEIDWKVWQSDEEKTAFHTSQGIYCYTKMPFGLTNASATYQPPVVDKAFDSQVGRNIKVYVDNLVIKSHTETKMLRDIDETFCTLRKINMKLNPKKCTFGAVEGMFLGYMISPEGIKPCPDVTPTPEAEQAFKQLKQHLSKLPLLVAPKPKEELIVYQSASHGAISAVLMTERGTIQTSVYFISCALQGPELNYTPMKKLVLAPVFAAKRLRRYFQAHRIVVITDQPIKQIISRPDVAGRLQKWSVMLGEHNITYRPRTSVKGQILADFLVEKPDEAPPDTSVIEIPQEPWKLFTDGSCVDGSGAGLILTSPEGTEFTYALRFQFTASNNEAEYEALIAGLRIAAQMGVRNVHVSVDSKLVANQVLGTYIAKEENMVKYLGMAKSLISGFANFSISQVPRSKNKKADALSKIASTSFAHLSKQVLVEVLKEKSIQEEEVATVVVEEGPTWMTLIMDYLKDGTLLGDRKEASKLRIKARQYELWEGVLYRRSFLKPWLRCVGPLQADYVIREIHEGSCKAKAVATITGNHVKKFVWDNIVCRFGLPGEIVSDNGKQFSDNPFKDWCEKLNITQRFASVKHPQSNGLVERANRSLGKGIKARLGEGNKNWIEELPHVLWAHRTMIKSSHGDTPFSLTYGTKAVIPAEIGMPMYRTAVVDAVNNNEQLRLNLDLLEELRERAAIREAKAKLKMTKYYNARVRGVTFRPGDFVYRRNEASHAMDEGKLGPKWEGPYEVTEALGDGGYMLRSMDGSVFPRTWNIANLKKCYL
ncbi:reverse transcriptase domain-containing protein [Tanacetum coccineum]